MLYSINVFLFLLLKEEKYHIRRIFTFEGPSGVNWDDVKHVRLNFMLPHVEKLAVETNYDKYFLFILASGTHMFVFIQLYHQHAYPFFTKLLFITIFFFSGKPNFTVYTQCKHVDFGGGF